ncbi:MAG: NUDIX hydrolase [Ardenticatenales bacterium]|nr:NUDIX hydrolase [Ardenticatenales bacterium]
MPFEPWTVLSEEQHYENRWVRVRAQRVRLPNGVEYDYTLVDRPAQGVAVMLFDNEERLLLEQEYRHAVQQVVWQVPGGLINESEPPLVSAKRELLEESGYEADEWLEIGSFYDNPGLGNASSLLFLARLPRRVSESAWDEAEAVELHWVTLSWLREAVQRGEIVDRVVLSGLGMLWARGEI